MITRDASKLYLYIPVAYIHADSYAPRRTQTRSLRRFEQLLFYIYALLPALYRAHNDLVSKLLVCLFCCIQYPQPKLQLFTANGCWRCCYWSTSAHKALPARHVTAARPPDNQPTKDRTESAYTRAG